MTSRTEMRTASVGQQTQSPLVLLEHFSCLFLFSLLTSGAWVTRRQPRFSANLGLKYHALYLMSKKFRTFILSTKTE